MRKGIVMTLQQQEEKKRNGKTPHGIPGQFNVYVLDRESDVTNYGKHNRLLVLGNVDNGQVMVREDHIGLPSATETDRQRVLNGWQRQHKRGTRCVLVCCERELKNSYWYYNIVKK
jgi:hypothetical protein